MKEEIGKMIELLNERIREKRNELSSTIGEPVDVGIYEYDKLEECITYDNYGVSDECIISKKEGFIKRLFENDKIDWSKFHKYSFYKKDNKFIQYYDYESLLMALSISETPIEDLISYLR